MGPTGRRRATSSPTHRATRCNRKVQVWAVPAAAGAPTLLGDGDEPAIAPSGNRVAFVKDRRIWIAPLDGSKAAEQAFFARGASESPVWSPDGRTLAFVSNRDDHSFIGLFTDASRPIRYLAPSTSRDSDPVWSPDGRTIAYVRQPGRGGVPASALVQQPSPWAIWVADAATGSGHEAWKSGTSLVDSIPRTAGGANLHWGAGERLVFLSYQDDWPHLYSVAPSGGAHAAAADAWRVHGRARLDVAGPQIRRVQREHRAGSQRHRSPAHLQGARRRIGAARGVDERPRHRMDAGRDRRRPHRRVPRVGCAALAAAHHRADGRRPDARRWPPIACLRRCPPRRS